MDTEDMAKIINDVLTDFPCIIDKNFKDQANGVAMYSKNDVEPLLQWVIANLAVPSSSGDSDDSEDSDAKKHKEVHSR